MPANNCDAFDAESLEQLFEPTVEIPAALLLAGGCCCCTAGGGLAGAAWPAQDCC